MPSRAMQERSASPLLLIVSSPSGAGKTTLTNALRKRVEGVRFSVSHTTRKPRSGESDGKEYHFVDRRAFEALIAGGEFLEWALVHENFYGTSCREVERARDSRVLLFDVDYQGARQIKCAQPAAVTVFILPPDMQTLESRLKGRASETEDALQRRFAASKDEIAHYGFFDYLLVNDDLPTAIENLVAILRAEECRRQRGAQRAERLLADVKGFGGNSPPG